MDMYLLFSGFIGSFRGKQCLDNIQCSRGLSGEIARPPIPQVKQVDPTALSESTSGALLVIVRAAFADL